MNFPARNKPTMWDVYLLYFVLPAVAIAISLNSFSSFWPRRPGVTFCLDAESNQRNQEKTMLPPAWPTRTSPFFQACAHGVNQLAQTFSFASNAN
jgi:hypothetical protein